MASKCAEKLNEMVTCPICLAKITKPKILQCLHFYCESCITDMKPAREGRKDGKNCPMCRKFTANDQIRDMHFMQELLEIADLAIQEKPPCDQCKSESPKWKCAECKETYCDQCKTVHDRFPMMRNHTCVPLTDESPPKVDRHVFCSKHPEQVVQLYCSECQELICILCNGTEHKNHQAETIKDALARILPQINKSRAKLETVTKGIETALRDTTRDWDRIEKEYGKIEQTIDARREQALQKVEDDYKKLKQEFVEIKSKHSQEIEAHKKKLELNLQGKKSLANYADSVLESAEGTSLLQAIESDLQQGLDASNKEQTVNKTYRENVPIQLVVHELPKESVIGQIQWKLEERTLSGTKPKISELPGAPAYEGNLQMKQPHASGENLSWSRAITRKLTGLTELQVKLLNEVKLIFKCIRFEKVGDKLMFVKYNTNKIHIGSLSGKIIKNVTVKNVDTCRAITKCGGEIVLSATNGLFVLDKDGEYVDKIADGDFVDVSALDDKLYALEDSSGTVFILTQQRGAYTVQNRFAVENYRKYDGNTIQVTIEHIYVAECGNHVIIQLNHAGQQVGTYGERGTGIAQFHCPLLCGADPDGVILIADCSNSRFQTLDKSGTCRLLKLDGIREYPRCAVITENRLLVVYGLYASRCFHEFALE